MTRFVGLSKDRSTLVQKNTESSTRRQQNVPFETLNMQNIVFLRQAYIYSRPRGIVEKRITQVFIAPEKLKVKDTF